MGLSARRPKLLSLDLSRGFSQTNMQVEQIHDQEENNASPIVTLSPAAFGLSPSTPVTPLPGTPLAYDLKPSTYSSKTPITPGFANSTNPFSFSFSLPSSASSTSTCTSTRTPSPEPSSFAENLKPTLYRTKSRGSDSGSSSGGASAGRGELTLIPNFERLAGMGGMKRSKASGSLQVQSLGGKETRYTGSNSVKEECWDEREIAILESFLLNPLRPLSIPYPPGTLPPSEALDELTSQILHFHRPLSSAMAKPSPTACDPPTMTSSHSSPALQTDLTGPALRPIRAVKHRRTHSASGLPWKHSWPSTRKKLYEIARKEALGDSREDRFKGRADVRLNGRNIFGPAGGLAQGVENGPFSPMPELIPGSKSFDFMQNGTTGLIGLREGEKGLEKPAGLGPAMRASPISAPPNPIKSAFNPMHHNPYSSLPGAPARPTSLLQRGKSFTAEEFDQALKLNSSKSEENLNEMQVEVEPVVQEGSPVLQTVHNTPLVSISQSTPRQLKPTFGSSPASSDGPETPEAVPGITLTSPSPSSRNRDKQMKEMGSPTPGSDIPAGQFGELLTMARPPGSIGKRASPGNKNVRPAPLYRSRTASDGFPNTSIVAQFMNGPVETQGSENIKAPGLDREIPPIAKRQKTVSGNGLILGLGNAFDPLEPSGLRSPFEEENKTWR